MLIQVLLISIIHNFEYIRRIYNYLLHLWILQSGNQTKNLLWDRFDMNKTLFIKKKTF